MKNIFQKIKANYLERLRVMDEKRAASAMAEVRQGITKLQKGLKTENFTGGRL